MNRTLILYCAKFPHIKKSILMSKINSRKTSLNPPTSASIKRKLDFFFFPQGKKNIQKGYKKRDEKKNIFGKLFLALQQK